jgi:Double zinc ribbon
MNCTNCGAQNNDDNKFCVSCGIKLEKKLEQAKKFCPECGTENQLNNKFCVSCGTELNFKQINKEPAQPVSIKKKKQQQKHKQHKKYVQEKNFNLIEDIKKHKVAAAAVIVVVGYLLFQVIPQEPEVRNVTSRFQQTNIPVNSGNAKLNEIASKFVCSCGTCGELSLETCTCPTAEEEHAFINTMLSQNISTDEIIIAVANKYGWLKSEFYPQYKQLDKSKVWFGGTSQNLNNTTQNNLLTTNSFSNIATIADRLTIITQFECPCGQCNILELSDCNCNHPSGANEVKGFIDQKISESTYTVQEIIEQVDNKYGGKKI